MSPFPRLCRSWYRSITCHVMHWVVGLCSPGSVSPLDLSLPPSPQSLVFYSRKAHREMICFMKFFQTLARILGLEFIVYNFVCIFEHINFALWIFFLSLLWWFLWFQISILGLVLCGSVGWHSSCWCQHSLEHLLRLRLCFWSSYLLLTCAGSRELRSWGPCTHMRDVGVPASRLWDWPSPGHCGCLRGKPAHGRLISLSLLFCLYFCVWICLSNKN